MINTNLSICIPTYNRANFIETTLCSLIIQAKKYNIPIYISDNSSTDNTLEILSRYKNEIYEYIFYRTNSHNIGFDKNLIEVTNMSSSNFCWLFGDDDIIEDNSIEIILNKIENNEYKLFILNYSTYDKNLLKKVEDRHIPILKDKIYFENDYNQLLLDLFIYSTFIGSLIVDREKWLIEAKKYSGKNFIQNTSVFNYIIGYKALFLSSPLVRNRLGNTTWVNNSFRVWYSEWQDNLKQLNDNYSKSINKFKKDINEISIRNIFLQRAKKEYNYSVYNEYIKNNNKMSKNRKNIFLIISLIPVVILKYFYIINLNIKKPQDYKFLLYSLK
ncbi:MAG: glycosyltransferase family 2 protein [Cyanobacteriota bacterium]